METGPSHLVVPLGSLRSACGLLLESAGLDAEAAALVADSLVDAEARGIRSHGVSRLPIYASRVRRDMIDARAIPTVVRDRPSGVLVDAHNAIGHVAARAGVDLAVQRARTYGSCVVGVRNSNHCGTLAYYLRRATDAGMVALAGSNAPPTMAYHGGRTRAVGTNPLAIGVPRDGRSPIMLDMATSATARGKIILADQLGEAIPDGWAIDSAGQPTTDTKRALAGAVMPFAGAKGSGLAMMLDLLSGGLMAGISGAEIGDMYDDWDRPQQVSHVFVAIDPDTFLGRDRFLAHVTAFADRVHGLPPAAGFDGVLLPGEVEERALRTAERHGVEVSLTVIDDLRALAKDLGVAPELAAELGP